MVCCRGLCTEASMGRGRLLLGCGRRFARGKGKLQGTMGSSNRLHDVPRSS